TRPRFGFAVARPEVGTLQTTPTKPAVPATSGGSWLAVAGAVAVAFRRRKRTHAWGQCEESVKTMAQFVANRCHTPHGLDLSPVPSPPASLRRLCGVPTSVVSGRLTAAIPPFLDPGGT